jgi:hypothetical protein
MIETTMQLQSHNTYVAELHAAYAGHQKQVSSKVVAEDGSTREVTLHSATSGVKIIGPSEARYEGRMTYVHGTVLRDVGQMRYQDSWTETLMHCKGKLLSSGGARGFSSGNYVPLAEPPQ